MYSILCMCLCVGVCICATVQRIRAGGQSSSSVRQSDDLWTEIVSERFRIRPHRPHTIHISGCDATGQNALDGAEVIFVEDPGRHAKFLQPP
jgi:hypothetical protein